MTEPGEIAKGVAEITRPASAAMLGCRRVLGDGSGEIVGARIEILDDGLDRGGIVSGERILELLRQTLEQRDGGCFDGLDLGDFGLEICDSGHNDVFLPYDGSEEPHDLRLRQVHGRLRRNRV